MKQGSSDLLLCVHPPPTHTHTPGVVQSRWSWYGLTEHQSHRSWGHHWHSYRVAAAPWQASLLPPRPLASGIFGRPWRKGAVLCELEHWRCVCVHEQYEYFKMNTTPLYRTLLRLAVFRVAFGQLYESRWSQRHSKRKFGRLNKLLAYFRWWYGFCLYCIYCASAPSLHREATDSLIASWRWAYPAGLNSS